MQFPCPCQGAPGPSLRPRSLYTLRPTGPGGVCDLPGVLQTPQRRRLFPPPLILSLPPSVRPTLHATPRHHHATMGGSSGLPLPRNVVGGVHADSLPRGARGRGGGSVRRWRQPRRIICRLKAVGQGSRARTDRGPVSLARGACLVRKMWYPGSPNGTPPSGHSRTVPRPRHEPTPIRCRHRPISGAAARPRQGCAVAVPPGPHPIPPLDARGDPCTPAASHASTHGPKRLGVVAH